VLLLPPLRPSAQDDAAGVLDPLTSHFPAQRLDDEASVYCILRLPNDSILMWAFREDIEGRYICLILYEDDI
jgi:hypothetical protein